MNEVMIVAENRKLAKIICNILSTYPNMQLHLTHFSVNTYNDLEKFKPKFVILDSHVMFSVESLVKGILNYDKSIFIFVIDGQLNNSCYKNLLNLPARHILDLGLLITEKRASLNRKFKSDSKCVLNRHSLDVAYLCTVIFSMILNNKLHEIDKVIRNSNLNEDYIPLEFDQYVKDFFNIERFNRVDEYFDSFNNIKNWFCNVSEYINDNNYSTLTRKCYFYILTEYKNNASLEEAAINLNVSKCYLSRVIKSETNSTYLEKLTSLRMFIASQLLICTEDSISLVSKQVGISDSLYFSRKFKQHFGLSPKSYRIKLRLQYESNS